MSEEARQLQPYIDHLRFLAKDIERDNPHWFEVDNDEQLEGIPYHGDSFCRKCANEIWDKYKANGGDTEKVSIASGEYEDDVPEGCRECGLPLVCTYTDYAIQSEIEHYEMYGDSDTLDPEYKYEPAVLLDLAEACTGENSKFVPRLLKVFAKIMPNVMQEAQT